MDSYLAMLNPQMQQQVGSFYGFGGYDSSGINPYGSGGAYNPNNPYANINPYRYAGMDVKEGPGDRLLADLIRAQTQDYNQRFAPIENMLAGSITRTGTTFLPQELERTREAFTGAAQNVQGMSNRAADRLGVQGAQMSQNSATSALVGGLNETRQRDSDRRLQLLTGGLSGLTQAARNIGQ